MNNPTLTDWLLRQLPDLRLQRLGPEEPAGLWTVSLPWPQAAARQLALNGQATSMVPLGQWPGEVAGAPRRLLLATPAPGSSTPGTSGNPGTPPPSLGLTDAHAATKPASPPPSASAELFESCQEEGYMWERHLLRLSWGGRSIGLTMGLRHAGEIHWWECCRLVVLAETPTCRIIEMGGAIPRIATTRNDLTKYPGYTSPFLHHHNWLNGHIYARLYANGVCEVFAHQINSRFFDDGQHLEDVVPVMGIASFNPAQQPEHLDKLCGPWRGDRTSLDVGGVKFDLAEVARLATPEHPGSVERSGQFLVFQPYEGVELFGGLCPRDLTGDPFIFHAEKRLFPRGMARTLRFSLSFSDQSPRIARYLPPPWWYGLCAEFDAKPLLPVSNDYDRTLQADQEWVKRWMVRGGFEDGALIRHTYAQPKPDDRGRHEPSWEGEVPHAQFMLAWRNSDGAAYDDAMRSAYFFTDVAIDHAAKMVRMHGYAPHAFALPMNRVLGTIAAYLECGDPYLIEAAQGVVDNSHWTQKNSWPRMAVGRDAKYVRSAVMLYRYLGDEHYRRIAHEGAMISASAQRENGSFGDQAGGTGIHQWGAYITKPWMALMATEGVLDYLDLFPADKALTACVRRAGEWLLRVRYDHNGVMGWGYQHEFNGQPRHFDPYSGKWSPLPGPHLWHQDTLGRLLLFCTLETGDGAFADAWAESYAAKREVTSDHVFATSVNSIPWVQARLWNALPTGEGIRVRPVHFGNRTPTGGVIISPTGPVGVRWGSDARVTPAQGVEVVG